MKDTSKQANQHMNESGKKMSHKEIILDAMKNKMSAGGGTFEEIARASHLGYSQVWKRMSELKAAGLVVESGMERALRSKCNGGVWILAENYKSFMEIGQSFLEEHRSVSSAPGEKLNENIFTREEYKKIDEGASNVLAFEVRKITVQEHSEELMKNSTDSRIPTLWEQK